MIPHLGLGGWSHLLCHISTSNVIISLYAMFQISSMNFTLSRIPDLKDGLRGCLGILTGDLKDGVIFDILVYLG